MRKARLAPRTRLLLLASLTLAVWFGCGGVGQMTSSPGEPDAIERDLDGLRQEQMTLLYAFDTHLAEAGGGQRQCDALCEHHTKICTLATRICTIAEQNPGHYRAQTACRQANQTCSDTNERLPNECWCRGS